MTRKDFELIAGVLRRSYIGLGLAPTSVVVKTSSVGLSTFDTHIESRRTMLDDLVDDFADELKQTNSGFDAERFKRACRPE
jgi:hypothetical protein